MDEVKNIKVHIKEGKYNEAYELLSKVDQEGLYIKGKFDLLVDLYTQLDGKVDSKHNVSLWAKLGRVYYRMGIMDKALDLLNEASSTSVKTWQSFAASVLGGLHVELRQQHEQMAITALEGAITAAEKYGEMQIVAGTKVRLARIYSDKGDHDKALGLIDEAIEWAKKDGLERDLHIWNGYRADVFVRLEKKGEAKEIYEEVIPYFTENNDVRYLEHFKSQLGSIS